MMDIVGSIFIGIIIVTIWGTIMHAWLWFESKWESYRHAKWNDKNLNFIKHLMRRKRR
jgi:xanthine/uracil/vitamin C permease (AzgA family)